MEYSKLSDDALQKMHSATREALKKDDSRDALNKIYGVREHDDFKEQSDTIEAELTKRQVSFSPIIW